jgi:hypothetical protein
VSGPLNQIRHGVNDIGYRHFGEATHTVTDRSSPMHAGEQVWAVESIGQPIGNLAFVWLLSRLHSHGERAISRADFASAVDQVRQLFLDTFGLDAFRLATGFNSVAGGHGQFGDFELEDKFWLDGPMKDPIKWIQW